MNRFDCIYNRARTTIPPRPNAPQMICSRVAPLMVQFATPSLRAAARSPFPLSLSFSRKLPASLFSRDKVVTIPELGCKLSRNVYIHTHTCVHRHSRFQAVLLDSVGRNGSICTSLVTSPLPLRSFSFSRRNTRRPLAHPPLDDLDQGRFPRSTIRSRPLHSLHSAN